jgi:hypothetical protein
MEKELVKTDVAVIGSGPGGISAAVAAAREGAQVVLVERLGYLGGQLGSGLPFLAFLDMRQRQVVGGLAQKMVDDLDKLGATAGHQYCPLHLSSTTVNQFYTRIICFQWAKDLGIQLLMHCELSGADVSGGRLRSVTVTGKGKAFEIEAKVFIDGTGDGDLGFISGASFEIGQEKTGFLQPPTLMFNLSGVNFDRFTDYLSAHPEELPYGLWLPHLKPGYDGAFFKKNPGHIFLGLHGLLKRLRAGGECPVNRDTIIYIRQPIPGTVAVNTIRILNFDGSNIHDLSRGEMEAHLQIIPLVELFRKHVPGFEEAYLSSINPGIGVRESRRIMGIKKLTGEAVSAGLVPDDSIGLFSYFIDIHQGDGTETYTKAVEEPYGVPYGCTVSKDIDGLMMTGRCISTDAIALGSSRIMTLCMAIGEGAGIGAALAVKNNISPAAIDVRNLRQILLRRGAILEV